MSVGLEIFNNNNRLIINESFKNLCLQRMYKNLTGGGTKISLYHKDISAKGTSIGFSIPVAQDEVVAFTVDDSVSVWASRRPYDMYFAVYGDASKVDSFTAYVFGERMKRGPLGLQIFDEAENVIFDSNNKFMQVIDFKHHANILDPHGSAGDDVIYRLGQEYAYNKRIAIIPLNMPATDYMDGEMSWELAKGVITFTRNGHGVRLEKKQLQWEYGMMPARYFYAPIDCMSFLVIDIEGM